MKTIPTSILFALLAFAGPPALPATPAASAAASTAAAAIPAATFFNRPNMSEPVMSPDGTSLAILVRNVSGRRQLAILPTDNLAGAKVIAAFLDADINWVTWTDDKRLIFRSMDEQGSAAEWHSVRFAIDSDGENEVIVGGRGYQMKESHDNLGQFLRTLSTGTGDVAMAYWADQSLAWSDSSPKLFDTHKGLARDAIVGRVPHGVQDWFFDEAGKLRAAQAAEGAETVILAPETDSHWTERARFPLYDTSVKSFDVLRAATDGQLYALRNVGDARGSKGLYRLDERASATDGEPILTAPGFDMDPDLVEDHRTHRLLGAHIETDAPTTAWFDPEMKALQARIDARLPGLVNQVDVAECGCARRVLVTSASDRQPPLFFLFDRSDDTLVQIGSARPGIAPREMAHTSFQRIQARDGQEIPVYVTKPAGRGPFPTVVLVHGGPYLRGWGWLWDGESQFLASRGYLVVKPEFRGSTGYGQQLFLNGLKQWGLKMQDDIADATTWAAAQGLADPARTCIAGASYGGYATLMGLVRYPELYKCGVAWAAVTDINLMFDVHWSDASEEYKKWGMPLLIGDQTADAERLRATSPLEQAARITRPLLLAHGALDARVPYIHASKLRRALESHGAPLTWIEYPDEAHGWYKPETRASFYDRMQAFLESNIGHLPSPAASQGSASAP